MAKSVRLADVASAAGVSVMAVSHVLNGSGKGRITVSPEKTELIQKIAAELGYRSNVAAQMLRGQRSQVIGVLADGISTHPIRTRSTLFLQQGAAEYGYHVMTSQSIPGRVSVEESVAAHQARGVDGIIFIGYPGYTGYEKVREALKNVPHQVSVLAPPDAELSPVISCDFAAAVEVAVEHLRSRGRRRIVHLMRDNLPEMIAVRREGFLRRADLTAGDQFVIQDMPVQIHDPAYGEVVKSILATYKPDAIIAGNDRDAASILRQLRIQGVSVPDDVAVVGWGNEDLAFQFDPGITTVGFELPMVMKSAVEHLVASIENGKPPPAVDLKPPFLAIRETS